MNHLIKTRFGQFLVTVNETEGYSIITDVKSLKQIAKVEGTKRADFSRALRNVSSLVLIQAKLVQGKVTVINNPTIPSEMLRTPLAGKKRGPKVKKASETAPEATQMPLPAPNAAA